MMVESPSALAVQRGRFGQGARRNVSIAAAEFSRLAHRGRNDPGLRRSRMVRVAGTDRNAGLHHPQDQR